MLSFCVIDIYICLKVLIDQVSNVSLL